MTYKPKGATIVTVPLDPKLHHRLRVRVAQENNTIKEILTRLIEDYVND